MTSPTEPTPQTGGDAQPPASRIAFERLRERTDELELIISGMLAFALLTVPGRIFERWAAASIHVEGIVEYALRFGFIVSVGLSYSLAFAFIIHLAIRGYWIALIGLKSTFPDGIRWDRIPLMDPVARAFYRERTGDLGSSIDRVDRIASILFAMAILLALTMAWIGVLAVAMILLAGLLGNLLGHAFGNPERNTGIVIAVFYLVFMAGALLPLVAGKIVARREAAGLPAPGATRVSRAALRAYSALIPQRLIVPVQFTLQSNLPGRGFMVVYVLMIMFAMVFGGLQVMNSAAFSMLNRYDVMTGEAVGGGMLSAHYESLRSEHDVLLLYPMIPSDRIADTHLRVFIPHRPQIDNQLARERCNAFADGRNAAEGEAAASGAVACITSFWTVTLDGKAVPLDGFLPFERRDLGMRGLVGYVPIADLAAGRHDLRLTWNADGEEEGMQRRREYRIPFWFTPGIEVAAKTD